MRLQNRSLAVGLLVAALASSPAWAVVVPDHSSRLAQKEFRHPALHIPNSLQRADGAAAAGLAPGLAGLGVSADHAYLDLRGGRWGTLLPAQPLIPGSGVGNSLSWAALNQARPQGDAQIAQAAWGAFVAYLRSHQAALAIDVAELAAGPGNIGVHDGGEIVQIYGKRVYHGVPVRDSYLTAVVNHGNLVLFGTHDWGTLSLSTTPDVPQAQAEQALANHVAPAAASGYRSKARLAIVPLSAGPLESLRGVGNGYAYRLAWVLSPKFEGELGNWEALVDAHSGELLSFVDTNAYQSARRVLGGAYPVSNDGVVPDGVEQAGTPMPYADALNGGTTYISDTGGNLGVCLNGDITSALAGRYVKISDTCGAISETSPTDIDLSQGPGTDCTVPAGHSAGDTHAARSGYYELNKQKELARGQLPGNTWLQQQLTANMNLNQTCNAFWDGSAVNFFRSGGGCNNTGELAGVFDHEWGHGMDNNDLTGSISRPQEGIADIYAALRVNQSCLGRNFLQAGQCGGYGDPCVTGCDGVRDVDWANHASGLPHDLTWVLGNCGGGGDICGREVHCEGYPTGETLWDLFNRDLPSVFGLSPDTSLELATRLMYLGSAPVNDWYQCVQGSGGCPGTSAYMNFLAVDDDNGNLNDGTPHMQAIFQAFDRHGLACATPAVQNAGCANGPSAAPVVTGAPQDRGATLSWAPVPGAVKYQVLRTEGVFACGAGGFGKAIVGETYDTTFTDSGLQNGRDYSYAVMAVGLSGSCLSPMSACTTVTPASGSNVNVDPSTASLTITSGDGDIYLDNCENASVSFSISNIGSTPLTNVRIQAVQPLSHPAMPITATSAPVASLASCADAPASFDFRAVDLAPDDAVTFRVDVTSDEIAPAVKSQVFRFAGTEGDSQFVASQTSDFETDPEGWTLVSGTFDRTNAAPGGAGGANTFYFQSSAFLDNQCDEIHSPVVTLTPTSTLSLSNRFGIEPFSSGTWYDRANVALADEATGARTVVAPSSGRLYNVNTGSGPCNMTNDVGWADTMDSWATSGWTATDLGAAGVAGTPLRIDVKYGTDPGLSLFGFRFDQVTLTDFNLKVADAQSDVCAPGNQAPLAADDVSGSSILAIVDVSVLANDSDPDGNCLRVTQVTPPLTGTAVVNSVGCGADTVTYVPSASCGNPCNDSFQYTVSDGLGGTASANVGIFQGSPRSELVHGSDLRRSLAAVGGAPRHDYLPIRSQPHQSWEVVVDAATGDVAGSSGPNVVRTGSDLTTVVQTAAPVGAGVGKSLRWENGTNLAFDNFVRVESAGCTTNCTAEDVYRIRAYDTTYSFSRFNNSASQATILIVQNTSQDTVTGTVWLWDAAGALVGSQPLSLAPNALFVLNTASVAPGTSGTATLTHDGRYGSLAGKAVAIEPATGFTFDTDMKPKSR